MAALASTVRIVFAGQNDLQKTILSVEKDLSSFTGALETINRPLAAATQSILGLNAAVLGSGAAFGAFAVSEALKFQTQITEIAKVIDGGRESALAAEPAIRNLAQTYAISAQDAAESLADWLTVAGGDADQALSLLTDSLAIAQAGSIDAASATDLLKRSYAGFALTVDEVRPKFDILNALSNEFGFNFEQISEAIARTAPVARQAGLSFEQTAALLTPVVESLQEGEVAGRGFNSVIGALAKITGPTAETLNALGIAFQDQNGVQLEASQIIDNIAKAWPELTTVQKSNLAVTIAGKDQQKVFNAIFGDYEKVLNATTVASDEAGKAGTRLASIQKELNERFAAAGFKVEQAKVAFQNLTEVFGGQFTDKVGDTASAFTNLFNALQDGIDAPDVQEGFGVINDALREFERILNEVAKALPDAFAQADLSGFAAGLRELFDPLSKVTVDSESLAGFLEGLAETFETLQNFTKGVGQAVIPIVEGLVGAFGAMIEQFNRLDPETKRLVGFVGGISLLIDKVGVGPAGLAGAVALFKGQVDGLNETLDNENLSSAEQKILGFKEAIDLTGGAADPEAGGSGAAVKKWFDILFDSINPVSVIGGVLTDAAGAIASTGDAAIEAQPAVDWLDAFGKELAELNDAGGGFDIDQVLEDLADSSANLGEALQPAIDGFTNFKDAAGLTSEEITALNEKFGGDETKAAIGAYRDEFGNLVTVYDDYNNAVEFTKDKTTDLGLGIDDVTGVVDENGKVVKAWIGTYQTADGEIKKVFADVGESGKVAFDKPKKAAEDAIKKTKEFVLEMEKLASNERIALIEAKVALDIAQVEADTAKIEAAFGSINTAIESTGQTITAAFGALAEFAQLGEIDLGRSAAFQAILDQLEKENEFRKQAFDQQEKLNQAVIDNLKAKTEAFNRGDPLIRVDGTGLEPELRAIMWYMLRAIQVEVNAEFADFLLGLNPQASAGAAS